jgi:hypothetical protein
VGSKRIAGIARDAGGTLGRVEKNLFMTVLAGRVQASVGPSC